MSTTFDINASSGDFLVAVTKSNVERFRADFCGLLDCGVILSSVTVVVTDGSSTADSASLSPDHKAATWLFHAASSAEDADMTLVVTTNDGQTLRYSVLHKVG